jgi:hypothetical protein
MTKGATYLRSALHLLELPEHPWQPQLEATPLVGNDVHAGAMGPRIAVQISVTTLQCISSSSSPPLSSSLPLLLGMVVYLLQGLGDRLAWSRRKSPVTPRCDLHGGQAVEPLHYPGQRLRIARGMTTDLAGIHPSPFGVVVRSRSAQARSSAVCCRNRRPSPDSLHPAWWSGCPRQGRSPPV